MAQELPLRVSGPHWSAAELRAAHGPYDEEELQIIAVMTSDRNAAQKSSIISFGPDYLSVASDDGQTIIDVKLRRIIQVDRKAGTFLNDSLYAAVVLTEDELKKRISLHEAAARANASWPVYLKSFWIESDLGMEYDQQATLDLQQIDHDDGSVSVVFENQVVVIWEPSNIALTQKQSHKLGLYLQYQLKLHPRIRRIILAEQRMPNRIKYAYYQGVRRTEEETRFRLAQRRPSAYPLAEGVRPRRQGRSDSTFDEHILPLMLAAVAGQHGEDEKGFTDYLLDAWSSVATDALFEAWLILMEAALHYSHDMAFCADAAPADGSCFDYEFVREVMAQDARVEALQSALALGNGSDDLGRKIARLGDISRTDISRGYVMDVFRGDALSRRPDLVEKFDLDPVDLIAHGIRENPYAPTFYKILGDHFARNRDFVRAFLCFDLARALPQARLNEGLQSITRLEAELARRYSAFF